MKWVLSLGAGLLVALTCLALPTRVAAPAPDPRHPSFARPDLAFADVISAGEDIPQLHSLLVNWHGRMLLEHYFNGTLATNLANLKSASKSVLSALIGIAIDRGILPGLDTPISKYFPDLTDPDKQKITIQDLLSMRSGLQSTSNVNYGTWVASPDWIRYVLARPLDAQPGKRMIYSTGNTHLLSAILTEAAHESTWQFAQEALAKPLGFDLPRWSTDPQGIYFGGNEMLLTPKQMIAIGELYLHRGRVNGRQVVPAAWVDASCVPRTTSAWDSDRRYGYGWWIQEIGPATACFAWGYGGQYILVFRDLDLVVAATSSTAVSEERRGHRRRLLQLIEDRVLRTIRSGSAKT